jgi:hypothetical protein
LLLALSRLTRGPDNGAELIVSTRYDADGGNDAAEARLLAYTSALLARLERKPDHVAAR